MDAVDILILALRLLFVALLYVFLVAVLRLALRGLRPAESSRSARGAARLSLRVAEQGTSSLSPGAIIEVQDGTTLGRGSRADIGLGDPAVSAEHARVDRVGRGWTVTDLGSTNGTRVNGAPVQGRIPLREGDVVSLGTVSLEVVAR